MKHCEDCGKLKACVSIRQSDLLLCDSCQRQREINPPPPGTLPQSKRTKKEAPKTCCGPCSIKDGETTCICFICSKTFHLHCVGLSRRPPKTSNWCCKVCSNIPLVIRHLNKKINELTAAHNTLQASFTSTHKSHETLLKSHKTLQKSHESLQKHHDILRKDNASLRNEITTLKKDNPNKQSSSSKPEPKTGQHVHSSCLIIGDSIIKVFDNKTFENTVVKSISGATVSDIFKELEGHKDLASYKDIIIHAGTNDISRNVPITDTISSMEAIATLIMIKAPTANIHISAVCPRTKGHNQHKVETLNEALNNLCARLTCDFVDSSTHMTYKNGSIDQSQLADGLHLSERGAETFLRSLIDSVGTLKKSKGTWQTIQRVNQKSRKQ